MRQRAAPLVNLLCRCKRGNGSCLSGITFSLNHFTSPLLYVKLTNDCTFRKPRSFEATLNGLLPHLTAGRLDRHWTLSTACSSTSESWCRRHSTAVVSAMVEQLRSFRLRHFPMT